MCCWTVGGVAVGGLSQVPDRWQDLGSALRGPRAAPPSPLGLSLNQVSCPAQLCLKATGACIRCSWGGAWAEPPGAAGFPFRPSLNSQRGLGSSLFLPPSESCPDQQTGLASSPHFTDGEIKAPRETRFKQSYPNSDRATA